MTKSAESSSTNHSSVPQLPLRSILNHHHHRDLIREVAALDDALQLQAMPSTPPITTINLSSMRANEQQQQQQQRRNGSLSSLLQPPTSSSSSSSSSRRINVCNVIDILDAAIEIGKMLEEEEDDDE